MISAAHAPVLRFAGALCGFAALCGVASIVVLERQADDRTRAAAGELTRGDVDAGQVAIGRYGCGSCHRISGVDGARGGVGPSLDGFAGRAEIAGRLVNRPAELTRWLRHPQAVDPGNGMPDLSVTEGDARDMAAYLYTLRDGP